MSKIVTYFTDPIAPASSSWVVAAFIVCGVIAFLGFIIPPALHVKRKQPRHIFDVLYPLANVMRIGGLVGLLLLFLRNQQLSPFQYRGWLYVATLAFLGWVIYVVRGYSTVLPKVVDKKKEEDSYTKYLPKPKRKKI